MQIGQGANSADDVFARQKAVSNNSSWLQERMANIENDVKSLHLLETQFQMILQ